MKGGTSGKVSPVFRVFGQMNQRRNVTGLLCYGCVAGKRAAYSDSSRRSEQLSCTKFFHPSYGIFYMNLQILKEYLELLLI